MNGYFTHLEKFQLLLSVHKPIIICLQETHFKGVKYHCPKGYQAFFKNRQQQLQASGGVATYIASSYYAKEIPLNTELEAVAVRVHCDVEITVCNVYIPNSRSFSAEELTNLIAQLPKPRILLGDFNAHSPLWGDSDGDQRGSTIEYFLESNELLLLNTGDKTRFNSYTGNLSAIDLSMCDPVIFPRLQWSTEGYLYGSDHLPVLINLNNRTKVVERQSNTWNLKRANWPKFTELIRNSLHINEGLSDANQSVEYLSSCILKAAENSIETYSSQRRPPVPWWNSECHTAIKQSKQAYNTLKRHNNPENLSNFKLLRARARYIIKQSKKRSWEEYTSTMTSSTSLSEVWHKVRRIKGVNTSATVTSLSVNNNTITSDSEIAEALADHYCSASSTSNYDPIFIQNKEEAESSDTFKEYNSDAPMNQPITLDELEDALKSSHKASPGPDNIPYDFLLRLPDVGKRYLLALYNLIYRLGNFPDSWREAIVIPIHKSGKPRNAAASYRPISLTCTMCKLLEKILNRRLTWLLESSNLISPIQSGFRKHRCTLDNIVALESEIHEAFANKQHLIATFFDIEKAYDMVWKHAVLTSLNQQGISGNMLTFIRNFLHNRKIRVKIGAKYSDPRLLENGVPQGSVLSVTLFLVVINSVAECVESPVKASLFADDIAIYIKGKSLHSSTEIMQKTIDSLTAWSRKTGFKFSASKTRCILFSKRSSATIPTLSMNNHALQFEKSTRFLGVTFDSKLTWKTHIQQLRVSCNKVLNLLKVLSGHKWGCDTIVLLRIYKALIRSRIDYGSVCYGTASKTDLKVIDTIQSSALRIVLGAFRTSPVQSLLCLAGESPLHIRRQEQTLMYAARVLTHQDNLSYNYVCTNRFQMAFRNKPLNQVPLYERVRRIASYLDYHIPYVIPPSSTRNPPWLHPSLKFNMELENFPKSTTHPDIIRSHFESMIQESEENAVFIYTDASKSNTGVGAAIITDEERRMYSLPKYTTTFTAELFAILKAVDYALEYPTGLFNICTDSLGSLKALHQLYPSNILVQQIKDRIASLPTQVISLTYSPGHVGIAGNEFADTAAKDAVDSTEAIAVNLPSLLDLKPTIRDKCLDKWQQLWQQTTAKLRDLKPSVKEKIIFPKDRWQQVILSRLRIGHCRFTHEHLITKTDPPLCSLCRTQVTVKHILIECPQYHLQRLKFSISDNLTLILGNTVNIPSLIGYLKDISILSRI